MRRALFVAVLIAAVLGRASALAQNASLEPASPQIIESETRLMADLDGPQPGEKRRILIWRAPSTGEGPLPTLYMTDGANGLYVVAARLRPAIEAHLIPPVQIIALYPDLQHRQDEYIAWGRARFRAHERWLMEVVIPWAERVARASPDHTAIGGYSNGAAFALFMTARHPDVFSGVLAHSPVSQEEVFHVDNRAAHVRWALSAGLGEMGGYPFGAVNVVAGEVHGAGAAVRVCTGRWDHDPHVWGDLSPGQIAWMFNFPNYQAVATALDRDNCRER